MLSAHEPGPGPGCGGRRGAARYEAACAPPGAAAAPGVTAPALLCCSEVSAGNEGQATPGTAPRRGRATSVTSRQAEPTERPHARVRASHPVHRPLGSRAVALPAARVSDGGRAPGSRGEPAQHFLRRHRARWGLRDTVPAAQGKEPGAGASSGAACQRRLPGRLTLHAHCRGPQGKVTGGHAASPHVPGQRRRLGGHLRAGPVTVRGRARVPGVVAPGRTGLFLRHPPRHRLSGQALPPSFCSVA